MQAIPSIYILVFNINHVTTAYVSGCQKDFIICLQADELISILVILLIFFEFLNYSWTDLGIYDQVSVTSHGVIDHGKCVTLSIMLFKTCNFCVVLGNKPFIEYAGCLYPDLHTSHGVIDHGKYVAVSIILYCYVVQ